MSASLAHKNILLGITGSIAAYKSADLVRRLREAYASVRVVMTENAKKFITPLTMQAVSGYPVHDDLFDVQAEAAMGHIELARWADILLVAPATADFMARLATGEANDLLTTIALATQAPIMLAPAMNQGMWQHTLTQKNLQALASQGVKVLQTNEGSQACGDVGPGRMLEPKEIIAVLTNTFATGSLAGLSVMITAGPTQEAIDPVRYLSNASSGKMGYALAVAAQEAGAKVTLVSGPVELVEPQQVRVIKVKSALQMHEAVMATITDCDIFIAVAAVADYRPKEPAATKLHKKTAALKLDLVLNPDIVASVAKASKRPSLVIGFAAETEDLLARAKQKLLDKNLDLIVANLVGEDKTFGEDESEVTVISPTHEVFFPRGRKQQTARSVIELIANEYKSKSL